MKKVELKDKKLSLIYKNWLIKSNPLSKFEIKSFVGASCNGNYNWMECGFAILIIFLELTQMVSNVHFIECWF